MLIKLYPPEGLVLVTPGDLMQGSGMTLEQVMGVAASEKGASSRCRAADRARPPASTRPRLRKAMAGSRPQEGVN